MTTEPAPPTAPPRHPAGAHRADAPADTGPAAIPPPTPPPAAGDSRLFSWRDVADYFTPPAPWADPPASLSELSSYAHVGAWAPRDGFRRRLGIAYWYCLGLPATVTLRYGEWVMQRPGRLVTVLGLCALLWRTSYGRSAAHAVGWLLHIVFYPLTWLF
jgi:hypothetical protein